MDVALVSKPLIPDLEPQISDLKPRIIGAHFVAGCCILVAVDGSAVASIAWVLVPAATDMILTIMV